MEKLAFIKKIRLLFSNKKDYNQFLIRQFAMENTLYSDKLNEMEHFLCKVLLEKEKKYQKNIFTKNADLENINKTLGDLVGKYVVNYNHMEGLISENTPFIALLDTSQDDEVTLQEEWINRTSTIKEMIGLNNLLEAELNALLVKYEDLFNAVVFNKSNQV